jgi:hypothetical protein
MTGGEEKRSAVAGPARAEFQKFELLLFPFSFYCENNSSAPGNKTALYTRIPQPRAQVGAVFVEASVYYLESK